MRKEKKKGSDIHNKQCKHKSNTTTTQQRKEEEKGI